MQATVKKLAAACKRIPNTDSYEGLVQKLPFQRLYLLGVRCPHGDQCCALLLNKTFVRHPSASATQNAFQPILGDRFWSYRKQYCYYWSLIFPSECNRASFGLSNGMMTKCRAAIRAEQCHYKTTKCVKRWVSWARQHPRLPAGLLYDN